MAIIEPRTQYLSIEKRDGYYLVADDHLQVYGAECTIEKAVNDFFNNFWHLKTYYKNINDNKLTAVALRLKRRFAALDE